MDRARVWSSLSVTAGISAVGALSASGVASLRATAEPFRRPRATASLASSFDTVNRELPLARASLVRFDAGAARGGYRPTVAICERRHKVAGQGHDYGRTHGEGTRASPGHHGVRRY